MPVTGLFDRTFGLLEKVLDLRLQNQKVISSNIANADTPGYAPARLEFEEGLQRYMAQGPQVMARTDAAHLAPGGAVEARVVRERGLSAVGDGNGVELEREMLDLAENQILYEATTQMINKKLGLLKYVAQDGR
ncbi:flagellar basal body rod protein FlgB [Desulfuromonas versatilis]|uniref:Flagellar basal body rod protein FlgB n=1 Tax=Desulfuromonas versatilis TaxID=2802975 RepID=A0ABM8HZW0_9BACT|nr:flagellar basal body rod protein FlgB [Desulfuromonas versatilis]BCR06641.1 flagellar basal body rod protein FlgB [Desulfuromonas versatilis]